MALVVPNAAEKVALENFLNKTAPENLVLILFVNNVTPDEATAIGDLTEASGSGYASKALTAANWTITEGAPTAAQYPKETFSFTGALGNVYGYAVKGATSGALKWVERFTDGPYDVKSGDQIEITPRITME